MPPATNSTSSPLDQTALFKQHNISEEEFEQTKLEWRLLETIREHHINDRERLLTTGNSVAQRLQPVSDVHSLKVRIKNPDSLVAKIIRKNLKEATVDTYRDLVTDLIGVRVIHLFKDQWFEIHRFINQEWELRETPTAYVRLGDPAEVTNAFLDAGCTVEKHPFGYRSIHYLATTQLGKRPDIVEIQVRTIFEEGWAEIDHQVRYPRQSNDESLEAFLRIFNRQAGAADEMGLFTKRLCKAISEQSEKLAKAQKDVDETLSQLNLSKEQEAKLKQQIAELRSSSQAPVVISPPTARMNLSSVAPVLTSAAELLSTVAISTCTECGEFYMPVWGPHDAGICKNCSTGA